MLAYQYGMVNAGDFAINIGSLDLLCDYYDEIIVISKLTSNDTEFKKNKEYLLKYYKNIQLIDGPFSLNRNNFFTTIKSYLLALFKYPLLIANDKYNKILQNVEVVFLNGGNLLRCTNITDLVRLFALIFPLKLAQINNLDYILLPQSTTSINGIGKKILEPYINSATIVYAREEISKNKLQNIFPKSKIDLSLDLAFFIKDRDSAKIEFLSKYIYLGNNNVCLTLRKEDIGDIKNLSADKRENIVKTTVNLVNSLLNNKFTVTFIIQSQKDKKFTEKIYSLFRSDEKVRLIEEYDPLILREIYKNSSYLFGMRLHSLILAMSVGTPVIGYFDQNWGNKNPGTLERYGMPYSYIDQNLDLFELLPEAEKNKDKMNKELHRAKNAFVKHISNKLI